MWPLQLYNSQDPRGWIRPSAAPPPSTLEMEKIVNNWKKNYFYPSYSTIYLFICFTFRGIIALSYRDLHTLFLSVMCPPYENWFNYWLSCPQLVKSVNGSIPILMSKRDWLSLWGFRKATTVRHEHYFSHTVTPLRQQYQALSFRLWKALFACSFLKSVHCTTCQWSVSSDRWFMPFQCGLFSKEQRQLNVSKINNHVQQAQQDI